MDQLYIYIYERRDIYIYTHTHLNGKDRFPSHLGHHRALVEFPVLYSRFSLVIYFIYNSGYMSIPISQITPPLFPPWCPCVCSLHLCLYFCFAISFICIFFLDSTKSDILIIEWERKATMTGIVYNPQPALCHNSDVCISFTMSALVEQKD